MKHTPLCHLYLGAAHKGFRGTIVRVGAEMAEDQSNAPLSAPTSDQAFQHELERRLLEIGLVEGAQVEILHEGPFGQDPMAIKVDHMRVALRRAEANAILVCSVEGI